MYMYATYLCKRRSLESRVQAAEKQARRSPDENRKLWCVLTALQTFSDSVQSPPCYELRVTSYDQRSAGPKARCQAVAYAVLARGIAAFLFAFLDLGAVGVVVVVGLVRRRRRRGWCWRSGAPDQFRVELTASACGAAVHELGGGAEPRAYGLADGLGLIPPTTEATWVPCPWQPEPSAGRTPLTA